MTPEMYEYIALNQPCTAREIADALGVAKQTVQDQNKKKLIHISDWRKVRGQWCAVYTMGRGYDEPHPTLKTHSVKAVPTLTVWRHV